MNYFTRAIKSIKKNKSRDKIYFEISSPHKKYVIIFRHFYGITYYSFNSH